MFVFDQINLKSPKREVLMDISHEVNTLVKGSGIREDDCRIFILHTTAGIIINENAAPAVMKNMMMYLKKLIPQSSEFSYAEGNSDAHIKSSLISPSLEVIIHEGKLLLGTW